MANEALRRAFEQGMATGAARDFDGSDGHGGVARQIHGDGAGSNKKKKVTIDAEQYKPEGPLSGMHVLVEDDERALRTMATRMLQRLGATSEQLDDGKDCENLLRERGHLPP